MTNQNENLKVYSDARAAMTLQINFAHMDKWMRVLKPENYVLWLTLRTFVNRKDTKNVITMSQNDLIKLLGYARNTFYRHIKPLYEYGLIDYQEYTDNVYEGVMAEKGQKKNNPQNIVVYPYPYNDPALATEELIKRKDWVKRSKKVAPHSFKGGRKKAETKVESPVEQTESFIDKYIAEDVAPETTNLDQTVEEVAEEVASPYAPHVTELVQNLIEQKTAKLLEHSVDLDELIKWVNKDAESYEEEDIILVIEQCYLYGVEIENTLAFCRSTYKRRKTILKKRKEEQRAQKFSKRLNTVKTVSKTVSNETTNAIPFFNWLDESEAKKPVDNEEWELEKAKLEKELKGELYKKPVTTDTDVTERESAKLHDEENEVENRRYFVTPSSESDELPF